MNGYLYAWCVCGFLSFYMISVGSDILGMIFAFSAFALMIIGLIKQSDDDLKK